MDAVNRNGSQKSLATADGIRLFILVALTAVLIALCVLLAIPFFPAITWGVALAIIAWPMHRRISHWISRPAIAAAVSTFLVVSIIVGCGGFVAYQLARETTEVAQQLPVQQNDGVIKDKLEAIPLVSRAVVWMDRVGVDVENEVRKFLGSFTYDFSDMAHGSASAMIQFLVAVFILFYAFLDRPVFLHALRDLLPFSAEECNQVTASAADSVHANLYATLVTSVIDTVTGGLMFWWLGLPAPIIWACVMFVLSILPIVGAGLVWVPAVIYLAISERYLAAAALLSWGILSFVIVDNFLYVRLAGARMRLHPVPAMISFLGGIAIFGVSGMILGPAILAVSFAFLKVWKQRLRNPEGPAAPRGEESHADAHRRAKI